MSDKINRRQAIKQMGVVAATGAAVSIGLANSPEVISLIRKMGKKMKVLLVNGSPHHEGCTFTALKEVESALRQNGIETEIFWIGRQPVSSCIGCGACQHSGRCFMNDVVNEFLDKADNFDGFVFGSPVHFAAATGAMTCFMDRAFFCAMASDLMAGKPAATIASCRRSGTTSTLDQLNKYPIHRGMPLVPSQYWPMVFGNTPDEIRQDKEGLQIMRTLGNSMAWLMNCIEAGKQIGINYPGKEQPHVRTNFIR